MLMQHPADATSRCTTIIPATRCNFSPYQDHHSCSLDDATSRRTDITPAARWCNMSLYWDHHNHSRSLPSPQLSPITPRRGSANHSSSPQPVNSVPMPAEDPRHLLMTILLLIKFQLPITCTHLSIYNGKNKTRLRIVIVRPLLLVLLGTTCHNTHANREATNSTWTSTTHPVPPNCPCWTGTLHHQSNRTPPLVNSSAMAIHGRSHSNGLYQPA